MIAPPPARAAGRRGCVVNSLTDGNAEQFAFFRDGGQSRYVRQQLQSQAGICRAAQNAGAGYFRLWNRVVEYAGGQFTAGTFQNGKHLPLRMQGWATVVPLASFLRRKEGEFHGIPIPRIAEMLRGNEDISLSGRAFFHSCKGRSGTLDGKNAAYFFHPGSCRPGSSPDGDNESFAFQRPQHSDQRAFASARKSQFSQEIIQTKRCAGCERVQNVLAQGMFRQGGKIAFFQGVFSVGRGRI